jgi:tRNA threonylcarbamoyladenosine biosynthesis protein TsaB
MALILSIDTSLEDASVCIAEDSEILTMETNNRQMDHASWIHTAISMMLNGLKIEGKSLSAVAVTSGPGSYTGLRVGMATAKGLCYALQIPLITETTLKLTALRVKKELLPQFGYTLPVLICPMVDARRMEVFTTLYDDQLQEKMEATAIVLDENSFAAELNHNIVVFCGNGSTKWKAVTKHSNAVFQPVTHRIDELCAVASEKYGLSDFSGLAYTEPAYLKNVYTGKK